MKLLPMTDSPFSAANSPTNSPTEAEHFKARYKPWLGMACLLLGGVIAAISLKAMSQQGGFIGLMVIGVVIIAMGGLYLRQPYFAIAPNRLTLYNLLGNSIKRYPFESFSHLSLENGTLYIESGYASKEKVNIRQWMVKSADWQQLQALSQKPPQKPPQKPSA
jgi:hypothetical protein